MRIKLSFIWTAIVPFCFALHSNAQTTTVDTMKVQVYFRQGYSVLDSTYRDNGVRLREFARKVEQFRKENPLLFHSVKISSSASPEGGSTNNQRLAKNRAARIEEFLRPYLQDIPCEIDARENDWDLLERLVSNSETPYRDEVLDIIRNTPTLVEKNGVSMNGRKQELIHLHDGLSWSYMYKHFFPDMRNSGASVTCVVEIPVSEPPVVQEPKQVSAPEPTPKPEPQPAPEPTPMPEPEPQPTETAAEEKSPFYMDIRTNMLYDLAITPNVGVEFSLGKRWAVGGNWMYAWWTNHKRFFWRIFGGDLNVRKYFGTKAKEKPLQGHHIGLYGGIVTYDFELGGRKGIIADYDEHWNYFGGIEYGYSAPIAHRLNLDFTIGLGYLGGQYKKYEHMWNEYPRERHYVWQSTHQRHFFGPTKAEISLVWLIGRGNVNDKKGGEQ